MWAVGSVHIEYTWVVLLGWPLDISVVREAD